MDKQIYEKKVHFFGSISVIVFMFGTMLIPLTLYLGWGLLPEKVAFIGGATTLLSIMIPVAIAEFLSYAPIVGSAGMYVMSISGNLSNIKIPASVAAVEATGVDNTKEEGEIISALSIGMSTITTEIVMLIGVILLVPFSQVFQNPALKPAFTQIVPALFGALIISTIIKNWKLSVIPIVFAAIATWLVSQPFGANLGYFTIPMIIVATLICTRLAYKMGLFTPKTKGEDLETKVAK